MLLLERYAKLNEVRVDSEIEFKRMKWEDALQTFINSLLEAKESKLTWQFNRQMTEVGPSRATIVQSLANGEA